MNGSALFESLTVPSDTGRPLMYPSLAPVSELCRGGPYISQVTRGINMFSFKSNNNFPPLTGQKRPRTDSSENSPIIPTFDRFFRISMVNGSFKTVSPFLLFKALQSTFGTLADTRKQADGSILIEVKNEKQSDIAKHLEKLHNFEVLSTAHKSLNVVKGVITCSDLQHCSDEEILENLQDQGVTEIYRIPNRKDNTKQSYTFIISFKLHQLPSRIRAGWYSIRVRPYIPPPMRCFSCQKFGHTVVKCTQEPLCPSCGHNVHPESSCTLPPKCSNCGESHSPRYKGCQSYKSEFEIQKLRTVEKLSYFDAKRKFNSTHPTFAVSFSSVAKGPKRMVNAAIQCDLIPPSTLPSSQSSFRSTLHPSQPYPSCPSFSRKHLPEPVPNPPIPRRLP